MQVGKDAEVKCTPATLMTDLTLHEMKEMEK